MERCHRQCSAELFQRRSRLVRLDSSIAFLRVAFGSLLVPSADPFMSVQGAILYQGDDESYYTLLYTYGAMDFFYIYMSTSPNWSASSSGRLRSFRTA